MNGVVIDERRIKVDFSQSVSKLWFNYKKGQMNSNSKDDKTNELMLPNENQKLEIRANKNFMNDNKNYKLLLENPDNKHFNYNSEKGVSNKRDNKTSSKHHKRGRSKSYSRSSRSSSRSRSIKRSRKKQYDNKYIDKKYLKHRERSRDKYDDKKNDKYRRK